MRMHFLCLIMAVVLGLCGLANAGTRYPTIAVADRELSKLITLKDGESINDRFRCFFWDYDNIDDPNDFAKLTKEERKWVASAVGRSAFFLHRYVPKSGSGDSFEFIVDAKSLKVLATRRREITVSSTGVSLRPEIQTEQGGADQPATAPELKSEGKKNINPQSEVRPR
jgi:hypothetical protein